LSEATVPYWSSRPGLLLQIAIAGFLGIFVGLGVALFMELLDRRVHTQNDVVKGLGLNVLAKV
jgi:capsular polysaccharide biosynthesis protein